MDAYEKLSRVLKRRKYEKVDRSKSMRSQQGFVVKRRSNSVAVKLPRVKQSRAEKRKEALEAAKPLPIVNPKQFTILSSENDVVDEAWLREAVLRVLDDGRLDVLTRTLPAQ